MKQLKAFATVSEEELECFKAHLYDECHNTPLMLRRLFFIDIKERGVPSLSDRKSKKIEKVIFQSHITLNEEDEAKFYERLVELGMAMAQYIRHLLQINLGF